MTWVSTPIIFLTRYKVVFVYSFMSIRVLCKGTGTSWFYNAKKAEMLDKRQKWWKNSSQAECKDC